MKNMERRMDILALDSRPQNMDHHEPQIINPNFRRRTPPQIRQRDQRDLRDQINQRNAEDQQVRPPFLDNFVDEEEEIYPLDNEIHHFDIVDSEVYLKKHEHNMFS